MIRRFRLAGVLRARQAQEDAVKAEVVLARGAARTARSEARERAETLRTSDAPQRGTAQAIVASLAARQALAADLAVARAGVGTADIKVDARLADLAEAAKRRRVVEKLGERHIAQLRAKDAAVEQQALDEIAVTAAARKGLA
ncbi:MAG TPA: flagellar FliJ family protein [Pilimelia sp.]|nr:flagellar FliJ family protein [Pilimelia sp.]